MATLQRFFLPPTALTNKTARFSPEQAAQIRTVLRLRPGARVLALDNQGFEYEVELETVRSDSAAGRIVERRAASGEPSTRLTLYLGLTRREKFEWMLQKCTEIGAAAFAPFSSSRTLVQDVHETGKKTERWLRILQEAAEQSRRGLIPELLPAVRFEQALDGARRENDLTLVAWEEEHALELGSALAGVKKRGQPRVAVFIGPEGGFSEAEIQQAQATGIKAVTLGARTLRMETAAIVATALVMHALESTA